jgi:hypothetical protein
MTTEIKKNSDLVFIGQKDLTKYEIIQTIVCEAFDAEFSRVLLTGDTNRVTSISEFFIKGDALSIYNSIVLKDTVETICSNHALLNFIFNITKRCTAGFLLSDIDFEIIYKAIEKSAAIDKSKTNMQYCLIPRPIQEQISLTEADVNDILRNNFWTGITYLSVLFVEKTQTYKSLVEKFNV